MSVRRRLALLLLIVVGLLSYGQGSSLADDDPQVDGASSDNPKDPSVIFSGTTLIDGQDVFPLGPGSQVEAPREYLWLLSCAFNSPTKPMTDCLNAHTCTRPSDLLWVLWARDLPSGMWIPLFSECRGNRPQGAPPPQLTPDRVLEAVRRIGLPSLQIQVQPETATLVNFATIFYAEPQPFQRTVGLLGYSVDVRAAPESFHWVFGDRTEATTQQPGAPYPVKDVTHEYTDAHVTVRPRVDVTYQVQYRVDGDAWQTLDETLTALGPAISLRIKEATPVLSGGN